MKTLFKALAIAAMVLAILKLLQIAADYCDEKYGQKYFRTQVDNVE